MRNCKTCRSEHRDEIDRRLLEGAPPIELSRRFGLSRYSLVRHARHLPALLARSTKAGQVAHADNLIERLEKRTLVASRVLEKAARRNDDRMVLAANAQLLQIDEVLAKVRGEITSERRTTNVLNLNLDAQTAERIARTYLLRRTTPEPLELP